MGKVRVPFGGPAMTASNGKPTGRGGPPASLLVLLCLAAGCSSTGTGLPFLSTPRHPLLGAAKDGRQPAPEAMPRELGKRVLATYVVEPGDVLLVQPVELDSPVRLPGDQPVLPDGTINLGKFGRLLAAGKTAEQIEAE